MVKRGKFLNFTMTYFVYILYSKKLARFYIGHTKTLQKRISQHNSGGSSYTSLAVPWTLIWVDLKPTKKQALILEFKLKNLTRVRKIKFMYKYKEGIKDQESLDNLEIKIK